MVTNYWLPVKNATIDKKFCKYCIEVEKHGNIIDRLNNTDRKEINRHYIELGQPVIVTDTTKDWGSKKQLTMDEIGHVCMFSCS